MNDQNEKFYLSIYSEPQLALFMLFILIQTIWFKLLLLITGIINNSLICILDLSNIHNLIILMNFYLTSIDGKKSKQTMPYGIYTIFY